MLGTGFLRDPLAYCSPAMWRRSRGLPVAAPPLPPEVRAQQSLAGADARVVVDVGAGYGETVGAYLRAFPDAMIYAFEPTPEAAESLAARRRGRPVEVIAAAVGAMQGEATLRVNAFQPTSSLLPSARAAASFWGDGLLETDRTVTVPVVTLDAFCVRRGIDTVDLLKIDVQGAERSVLDGARQLLDRKAVRAVYFEVLMVDTYEGQTPLDEYLALLRELGYRLAGFYGQVIREGVLLSMDVLAGPGG